MLIARQLIAPEGEIQYGWFPKVAELDVENRVGVWLDEGYREGVAITAGAVQDKAARNWAYYRAKTDVYYRLLSAPSSASLNDQGSASYLLTQIEHWKTEADAHLAAFEDAIPVVTPVLAGLPTPRSMSVANSFGW